MSTQFLSNLALSNLASDPGSGTTGELYYNTTSSLVRVYNGTAWSSITGGGGGAGTVTSVATGTGLTGGTITTTGTLAIDTAVVPRLNVANTFTTSQTITGSLTATSIVKSGGTSAQYLMADGTVTTSTGTGIAFSESNTPPVSPNVGDLWVDLSDGTEYAYVSDLNGSQWVELSTSSGSIGPQGPSGTNGATGATGSTGATGATGSSGVVIYDTDQAVISMQVFG